MNLAGASAALAPIVGLVAAYWAHRRGRRGDNVSEARADWVQHFEVLQAALDQSQSQLDQSQEDLKESRTNGRANRLEAREAIEQCKAHLARADAELALYRKRFGDLSS